MTGKTLSLTHLVREPRARSEERPPLLLLLHGVGSNEADLFGLTPYLDERFLVVSARAPVVLGPGSYGWSRIDFTPEGMVADLAQAKRSLEMLPVFIGELIEAYGADEKRTYLAGFSQGAMMSLALLLTRPEMVAGVAAMSGRLPVQVLDDDAPDREALARLPVIITHGIYDAVLPVEGARAARKYLEALPVELTYREYPMAHEVSFESLRDVSAWLTAVLDAPRREAR
jgi:phospholipase/carboxylesterase